jgi:hypothetical protein
LNPKCVIGPSSDGDTVVGKVVKAQLNPLVIYAE